MDTDPAGDPTERPGAVIDGHIDTLLAARDGGGFTERPADHVDVGRLRAGTVAAAFFAAFVPHPNSDPTSGGPQTHPPSIDQSHAATVTQSMLDQLDEWIEAGHVRRITTPEDVTRIVEATRSETAGDDRAVGAITHLEGAAAIQPNLSNLGAYYDRGVRSIGVVWSRSNAFGHGVPFAHDAVPDGPGLTDVGERLVAACARRGILVDCAHMTPAGVRDVARLTSEPLVVSHAACHAISPAARNLTDDQLRLVADRDGLVGVSFATPHLRPDRESDPDTPLELLLDHIDHAVTVAGVDHVGFGTDFDGATVLEPVGDPTGFERVREGLVERGYTTAAIDKLTHENWARVIRAWL
jgi:Zn-dependent dipeptidase, microsomal dipeptidase homolog